MPTTHLQFVDHRKAASAALANYLEAADPYLADQALGDLVSEYAMPAIESAVRSRLRTRAHSNAEDVDDICSDTVVALVMELQSLREQAGAEPILDFPAFAATLAHRACSSWSRRAFPAFHGLRNRLRYVLQKNAKLALWQGEGGSMWLCGLASWAPGGRKFDLAPGPLAEPESFDDLASIRQPGELLSKVFERAAHPVAFDELTRVVSRLWNVQDARDPIEESTLVTQAPEFENATERRRWLERLWHEVEQLLPRQRVALLLNLKDEDGCCATSAFVMSGVASLAQMAATLDIPELEFAELWKNMPVGDQVIADRLRITRQQVINLRKCARERLVRRMTGR